MGIAYFYSLGRQTWREFRYMGHKTFEHLLRTPLPRIFLLCLGIALICILLPLTISLFVAFLLLKIIFSTLSFMVRHKSATPMRRHYK